MKHFLATVSLVALSASAVSAAGTPSPNPHVKPVIPHVMFLKYRVAPADEYFGRLKLSILGIRNTIKDMGLKADADSSRAANVVMGSVGLTEDAIHDWEKKYPKDSWIPATIFSLERLYAKVDSDDARAHAKITMAWLVHDYPASPPAKIGKKELSQNLVGAKPAPVQSAATVVANPDGSLPIPEK